MAKKLTTEDFIEKAKQKHPGKYDYSKVEYVGAKTKVIIICPEHGEFKQTPSGHLSGKGCSKCGFEKNSNERSSTNEMFIKKAKSVHGDKYDYSLVEYVNNRTKVIIRCKNHGEFFQAPDGHLSGRGCRKCRNLRMSKLFIGTLSGFIGKSKKVHGDRYDYSLVEYVNSQLKVNIICKEHGFFLQRPVDHVAGSKCSHCSGVAKLTTATFTERAKEIHGDKYDYSKVEYVNSQSKVIIKCQEHGEFEQVANSHLSGNGCMECSGYSTLTNDIFIKRSVEIHGDKYDYLKVKYKSAHKKVTIICPNHGKFLQAPDSHIRGSGCPSCNACGGYNPNKSGFVYILRSVDHSQDIIKIGISNVPERRHKQLTRATPFDFNVVECFEVDGQRAPEIESKSHTLGESACLVGFDGATEWIKYDADLIEKVRLLSGQ